MIDKNRNINTSFGLFLTSFLIIGTVMIFAVLVFLSYQNNITKVQNENILFTDKVCGAVGSDISAYDYTRTNGELTDESFDLLVKFMLKSSKYKDVDWIFVTDQEGNILYSNVEAEGILDSDFLACLENAAAKGPEHEGTVSTVVSEDRLVSSSAVLIPDTDYCVIVSNVADPSAAIEEFKTLTLLPAAVALLAAIALFVGFTQLMIRPMRDITKVLDRAGEGDFSARVDKRYTNYDDMNSIVISADLQDMARNVNDMIEKLENQENDRNIFISSVAHDIRTPLTSINGFITAMMDGTIPSDQYEKYMTLIKQEVDRIRKLIVSMTEASSLSHIDPELMESFDLRDVVTDVIQNLEPQLHEKNITATAVLPEGDLMVYGEAQQLCRVIVNIISNAIKFTPVDGQIRVSASRNDKDRKMMISIEDSGPGVEKEKRSRVFESFYKTDPSRKQEGFGLGLYICKQILQGHGQTIVLGESADLGGADFVFSFPYPPEQE